MDKKIIKLDDTEIEEYEFHQYNIILIKDIYINKIVVTNKFPFVKQGFKYLVGFKGCIYCAQVIMYKRSFDENRHIYFLIKQEKVFIKYMKILEKISNIINQKFNSELIYSKKYPKAERVLSSFICTNNID